MGPGPLTLGVVHGSLRGGKFPLKVITEGTELVDLGLGLVVGLSRGLDGLDVAAHSRVERLDLARGSDPTETRRGQLTGEGEGSLDQDDGEADEEEGDKRQTQKYQSGSESDQPSIVSQSACKYK